MGTPEQGQHYNLVGFDEEMPNPLFYTEAHRGLTRISETVEQRPKGIWAATAQIANPELAELRLKAEADSTSDFVRRFVMNIGDNPYFSAEARREFFNGLSEEDKQTRYYGVPALQVRRVYNGYNPDGNAHDGTGHGCEPFEINPIEFTRTIYIDPGIKRCGVLFVATDRDNQFLTVYDGAAITDCSPRVFAEMVKSRQNGAMFERAVMDQQMGVARLSSREATTVAREYWLALEEAGVQIRQRGSMQGFFPACNNIETRTQALLAKMEVRGYGPHAGSSKLRVMRGVLPALDREIRFATTDPRHPEKRFKHAKLVCDLLDPLEYAAADDPVYLAPVKVEADAISPAVQALQRKQRRQLLAAHGIDPLEKRFWSV
jgi:hypothetical protein